MGPSPHVTGFAKILVGLHGDRLDEDSRRRS